jgi:hypothetical protein
LLTSATVYIVVMNSAATPLPDVAPVFTPSLPFASPPQKTVPSGASWHMAVQQGTIITVSAPAYGSTAVDTFGPGGNPPFVGTNHETPIEAKLSGTGVINLNVPWQQQQQSNWCWAAVSWMISHYYNKSSTWTQCSIATGTVNEWRKAHNEPPANCCDPSQASTSACNVTWGLLPPLQLVGDFGSETGSVDTLSGVAGQLGARSPVCGRTPASIGPSAAVGSVRPRASIEPSGRCECPCRDR